MTPILIPDAGPLITLAYAEALAILLTPGWKLEVVDMVKHEVTRNQTPTSKKIAAFLKKGKVPTIKTDVFAHYQKQLHSGYQIRKSRLGELAIQEYMNKLALTIPIKTAVLLFEDHKIAKTSFYVPNNVKRISTRAFLFFLENEGLITSATEIEHKAILNGRSFSQIRFP